jgi:peptide/nickel transport system substrate-binding protein
MQMIFRNILRRSALLGIAMALAVPAFGPANAASKMGGTLKISHSTRIATLNVLSLSGPAEYPVIDMAYSGLTRIGPDSQPMPDLAESWEASPDATEFTFNLRQGVNFHDGTPATASDVIATYEAILNPDIPASAASVLNMIETVTAIDDLTVKFKLKTPFADFPTSTAHANARILSEEALAGDLTKLDTVVNGTGPFKMENYDSARVTRLVRNDDYFIEGKPYLDAVEMHLFPDLAAETTNFLSGDIDVMLLVQQADYERISSAPNVNALRVPSGRYVNVVMRFDQPPFDDLKVREALAYSIDRQLLVDLVLEGLGRPAHDNILSPEFKFRIDTPEKAYDPEKAKKLLAEAGYPNGLKLNLVASNRPAIRAQVAIAIKQMALSAGFDINVETMPHDTYIANVWKKGKFYMAYWGMQPTEDATFNLLLTSNASYEDTGWKNKEFDELVQAGRSTTIESERANAYSKAQELMLSELPYIIAFYEDVLTASKSKVQGYTLNPINRYFYLESVWLEE